MKFCTHCGAQIPDNAKFCMACGTSIDAPDEATVTISDPEETVVEASEVEGEFVAASWHAQPAQPVQPVVPKEQPAGKKKGFFHYLWLYIKIIILVVILVMAFVFIRGVVIGYTSEAPSATSVPKAGKVADDDIFESVDDMPLHDKAEYLETLVKSAYEEIAKEERKGDKADEAKILELGLFIEKLRTELDQLAQ